MADKTPLDLTDEISLRLFLDNWLGEKVATLQAPVGYSSGSLPTNVSNLLSKEALTDLVTGRVASFNRDFNKTLDEAEYNSKFISTLLNSKADDAQAKADEAVTGVERNSLELVNLTSTVDTNTATISSNYTTLANADVALSESITTLSSTVDTNTATISSNYTTLAGVDASLASSITTLESSVGDNSSSISTIQTTYATKTEVGAIYGVNVEANGHVSGYKSVATGTSSAFKIYADKFAISDSAVTTEAYNPFQVDTVNHQINMTADVAIDGTLIVDDTITTDQIAANAITTDQMAANVLLIGGKIESSNYSWGGGTPVGFGMWASGDTTSGQSYNIIGGKLYGTELIANRYRYTTSKGLHTYKKIEIANIASGAFNGGLTGPDAFGNYEASATLYTKLYTPGYGTGEGFFRMIDFSEPLYGTINAGFSVYYNDDHYVPYVNGFVVEAIVGSTIIASVSIASGSFSFLGVTCTATSTVVDSDYGAVGTVTFPSSANFVIPSTTANGELRIRVTASLEGGGSFSLNYAKWTSSGTSDITHSPDDLLSI